jgi:hypothetical protein
VPAVNTVDVSSEYSVVRSNPATSEMIFEVGVAVIGVEDKAPLPLTVFARE